MAKSFLCFATCPMDSTITWSCPGSFSDGCWFCCGHLRKRGISYPCPILKTWVWKVGREDTLHFQHEAIESDYLVLCFCNFLGFVTTSYVIQAVLSAAMVPVQELILHPTWVTMQQVENWVSGCNSKFLELPQVLIWLPVICRFFLVWFNWVVSVNFVMFVCMQGRGRFSKYSVFTWT